MKHRWNGFLFVACALAAGCTPSITLRVEGQCRTRTGPYHFGSMPRPESPPDRHREGTTSLALRSLDAHRVEIVVGGTCSVTARVQTSSGSPWRPSRRFLVEAGQRCTLDLPEEGAQSVTINGPPPPRDPHILDGPPDPEASWVFVDNNNDVDLMLTGRTSAGVYDLGCQYRTPR